MADLEPIETNVRDASILIDLALEELADAVEALEKLDLSFAGLRAQQAREFRAALASQPLVLPSNVRPIRARAV